MDKQFHLKLNKWYNQLLMFNFQQIFVCEKYIRLYVNNLPFMQMYALQYAIGKFRGVVKTIADGFFYGTLTRTLRIGYPFMNPCISSKRV